MHQALEIVDAARFSTLCVAAPSSCQVESLSSVHVFCDALSSLKAWMKSAALSDRFCPMSDMTFLAFRNGINLEIPGIKVDRTPPRAHTLFRHVENQKGEVLFSSSSCCFYCGEHAEWEGHQYRYWMGEGGQHDNFSVHYRYRYRHPCSRNGNYGMKFKVPWGSPIRGTPGTVGDVSMPGRMICINQLLSALPVRCV